MSSIVSQHTSYQAQAFDKTNKKGIIQTMDIEKYTQKLAKKFNRTQKEVEFVIAGFLIVVIALTVYSAFSDRAPRISSDEAREMREIDQAMEAYYQENPQELPQ